MTSLHINDPLDAGWYWALFSYVQFHFIVCIGLFVWKRHHPIIQARQPLLTVLLNLFYWKFSIWFLCSLKYIPEFLQTNCVYLIIGYYYAGLPVILLLILKCGNLLFVYVIHSNAGSKDRQFYHSLSKFEMFALQFQRLFQEQTLANRNTTSWYNMTSSPIGSSPSTATLSLPETMTHKYGKRISAKKLFIGLAAILLFATACSLVSLYVLTPNHEQYECYFKDVYLYSPIAIILLFIVCPSLLIFIRKVDDNLGLKREMITTLSILFICYGLLLAKLITDSKALNIYVGGTIYMVFFFIVSSTLLLLVPALQTFRKVSSLDKSPESFKSMLANRELRRRFQLALVKDFCTENLIFYTTVEKLKKKESTYKLDDVIAKFFTPGGEFELNLPSKVIKQALLELKNPELSSLETLERIQTLVFQMMYENNYGKFLQAHPDLATPDVAMLSPKVLDSPKILDSPRFYFPKI